MIRSFELMSLHCFPQNSYATLIDFLLLSFTSLALKNRLHDLFTSFQPPTDNQQGKLVDCGLYEEAGEELPPLRISNTLVERVNH